MGPVSQVHIIDDPIEFDIIIIINNKGSPPSPIVQFFNIVQKAVDCMQIFSTDLIQRE